MPPSRGIHATPRAAKCGFDVVLFHIGQLVQNWLARKTHGEQVQHVNNANAHAANAGSPT